jgi:hypothetical protein
LSFSCHYGEGFRFPEHDASFAEELFASIIKAVPRAALKDEAASSLK